MVRLQGPWSPVCTTKSNTVASIRYDQLPGKKKGPTYSHPGSQEYSQTASNTARSAEAVGAMPLAWIFGFQFEKFLVFYPLRSFPLLCN